MVKSEVLQDDANFVVQLVDWQGHQAVQKTAKPTAEPSRAERMCNDVYGMRFFADLVKKHPYLKLHIPKVYEADGTHYIREYIDDEPVTSESMTLKQAANGLDKLAQLLADIDRIEPYGEVRFVGSSNWQKLHESIGRWADENVRDGIISQSDVDRANQISAGLSEYIRPRLAHGDMSPFKHAYVWNDDKIAFIDFENFTPEAARYFDVAWSYTRLWSFASTTDIPKYFLSSFLDKADKVANQREQLMAVIIQRTLGMQKDADADLKSQGVDFRDRAKELLELVLQNKLELLHS